jgi:hypothetical protein
MLKIHFSRMLPLVLFAAALAACGGTSELKHSATVANVPQQYDLSLEADKDGQFDFDGATVDKETVRGHIRYLNDAGKPVHSVFLKRGEKQKVTNAHILALSSIARDLKLDVYVQDNDGKLSVVKIDDTQ